MPAENGPYRVEQTGSAASGDGPRYRLAGPGLEHSRAYPWTEFREKLTELADVMNYAWQRGHASALRDAAGRQSARNGGVTDLAGAGDGPAHHTARDQT